MADTAVSSLTAVTAIEDTDVYYVIVGGNSRRITGASIKALFATAAQGALADSALQADDIANLIEATDVTFENLDSNGDVGTGSTQVAAGNHDHDGVYEPADADLTALAALTTPATTLSTLAVQSLRATAVKTSAYTAVAGDLVLTDSSGGAFTVTLPASPTHGDQVGVLDTSDSWGSANVTVGRNGQNIEGAAEDLVLNDGRLCLLRFVTGVGWKIAMLLATAEVAWGTITGTLSNQTDLQAALDAKQAADPQLDTWATVTPSANGQSLVAAANYAAMRTLLDLEAGTDFYSISAADAKFTDTANSPNAAEFARFTDATTIEGRTASEARADLDLEIGTDVLAFAGTGLVEQISGHIETAADKTYVLDLKAPYAYTINSLAAKTASGTCTTKLTIDGVDVTGITALAVSSTEDFDDATAANSVSAGNTVALVVSSNSTALDLQFTVKITRA